MSRRAVSFLLASVCLAAAPALPGEPFLLEDLAPGTFERSPFHFLGDVADGRAIFWAEDGRRGPHLWVTDGTLAGTHPYVEACPGLCRDDQGVTFFGETAFDGEVAYFVADDGIHGHELWRSDGTPEGTGLVADLCPGPCTSAISELSLVGDRLYFRASDGSVGPEPWTSDGTAQGTVLLGDLGPGETGSNPRFFLPLGDEVAFQAFVEAHGTEWWASDGTPEGTRRLTDFCPGSCSAPALDPTPLDGAILFSTGDFETIEILYRLEPSGEVLPLATLCSGDCDNFIPFLYPAGERLYVAKAGRLFVTDGTAEGTAMALELPAGVRRVDAVVELGNGVQLLVAELHHLRSSLWRLEDGALAGPLLELKGRLLPAPREDDAVIVNVDGGEVGLWSTDGTAAGTVFLERLPAPPNVSGFAWSPLVLPDGRVLVAARTGLNFGFELWVTDGEAGGAERLVGEVPVPIGSLPNQLTPLGEQALFVAAPPASHGRDLWVTDGTGPGTAPLAEGVSPDGLAAVALEAGERVFFTAFDGVRGAEPWLSDGTAAGTGPLADVEPGIEQSWAREPVTFEGALVFLADRGNGQKIWRSDGTEAGTELVVDVEPEWRNDHAGCPVCSPPGPPGPIFPRELRVLRTAAGPRLVFVARRDESGAELWTSDGTAAGTELVADLVPGPAGSEPEDLTVVASSRADRLFFTADLGAGRALWVWRGPGTEPERLRAVGEVLATIDAGGRLAWLEQGPQTARLRTSDGSFRGTDSIELPGAAAPELAVLGGRLYFVVADEAGAEPWTSDLTAAGTRRLADLWPGGRGSYPEELRVVAGRLVFSADGGASGREPWRYDPSLAGPPERLGDVAPGAEPSSPRGFTAAGAVLVFSADDGASGREPWAVALDASRECGRDATAPWGGAELRRRCWAPRGERP